MIILAGTIILALSQNGIIEKAQDAVDVTNIKEVEQASILAWAEEYVIGKRGEELETAVLDRLKDYTDKYNIVVNDSGVTVTKNENSQLVAGLYQADSNYGVLLKSWDALISEGIITEDGKIVAGQESNLAGELRIPDGITEIVRNSYYKCVELTAVYIPDSVIALRDNAFAYCSKLKSVRMPETDMWEGMAGCIFQRTALTSLDIPDGTQVINTELVSWNPEFTSVNIPASVTLIGRMAFVMCTGLTTITFEGTVEQWKAITFSSSWNGNVPATEVICTDGSVAL